MKLNSIPKAARRTALAVGISLIASGAVQAENAIAVFESKGVSDIEWMTKQAHGGAVLTVSGPQGFIWEQTFSSSDELRFEFAAIAGGYLPDGSYNYELVVSPALSGAQKADLSMMRSVSDELGTEAVQEFVPAQFELQSGSFRVSDGFMADATLTEARVSKSGDLDSGVTVPRDQQILDDLIVAGSACVGLDCNNGESFGFDTIRVKENNVRIKFQDTSTSASFPTNDWQLTANDSSNGGQNKFSIDDIDGGRTPFTIEAGASSHALYVDGGGQVGFGTSNPVVGLHHVDGNTPTLRLEQDGSSGFTPQIWDVAGNEAGFFVRDATNGSNLTFRIRPGAPASSIDIAADGDVGVGTASPASALHISRTDSNFGIRLTNQTSGESWVMQHNQSGDATAPNGLSLTRAGTGSREMSLDEDGNVTFRGNVTACADTSLCSPTETFPDYVFKPGYNLMPLAELAAYIADNGHLPNVPNVEEVAANGLNMTELQMKILEKVEELTLYTLEQEQTIKALRDRIATLETPAQD